MRVVALILVLASVSSCAARRDARIAELERQLTARDREIAELRRREKPAQAPLRPAEN